MIKRVKILRSNMSSKAMLSFFVATTVVLSSGISARAADIKEAENTINQIEGTSKDNSKFFIDRELKAYTDINKAQKVAGFDFKLPDYIGSRNRPGDYQVIKAKDNSNIIEIYFSSEDNGISYKIDAFKTDAVESLKQSEKVHNLAGEGAKVEVNSVAMNIGQIQGNILTLTTTNPEKVRGEDIIPEDQFVNKYFVWQDGEITYSLQYHESYKTQEHEKNWLKIENSELENIVSSMKTLDEIKNVDYKTDLNKSEELLTESAIMNIYDKEDVERAKGIIGFNPKMLLDSNDLVIKDSVVGINSDSDVDNNKINYEINNFYQGKDYSITFTQSNHDSFNKYNDIKTNGYVTLTNWINNKEEKVKVEKLDLDGRQVYKYKDNIFSDEDSNVTVCYLWEEDGIYYNLALFNSEEYQDNIVNQFVNAESIK